MILDRAPVPFTAGAVAYEFLLAPLMAAEGDVAAILTSIAWASGGVAVLWMMLVQMLRRARLALATAGPIDRKSTRLNSSHLVISYAVFCLKKKKKNKKEGE